MEKKKLLLVTDVMSIGGVERVIVNVLNGIDYSKFHITLFIMYKTEQEKINLAKIPKEVNIRYLFKKPIRGIYQRLLYILLMFFPHRIMNRLIVNEPYDIIVTTKDVFTYPLSINKCQKVMWIHGGLEYLEHQKSTILNTAKNIYKQRTYNKYEKIILLTKGAKHRFSTKYSLEEKCKVLNNPINIKQIIQLSNDIVDDYEFKHRRTIVSTSRLSTEKGIDRLIHCCSKLFKEGFDFHLLIIGDGPERANLSEVVLSDPVLRKKVTLLGFKDNPYKYLSKCDIYVSPSRTEGFSLSIAEAIILGLPIISTYCNGPAEILDNGKYGLLVENSVEGLYEGLKKMLLQPEIIEDYKIKSKSRKEFFSYNKNIKSFEDIIIG